MTIKFSNIRSAITDQIDNLTGFNLLNVPVLFLGRTQKTKAHLGFSVGVDSTNQTNERQRRINNGYYLNSIVTVKFLYRIRPLDLYPTDYDLCLDKEIEVIKACLTSYESIQGGLQIRYNSSVREFSNSLEFFSLFLL